MNSDSNSERISVLVIEDDEDDYILTRSLLEEISSGRFEPEWIQNYDEAVDRMRGNHYDVCLLDYRLGAHNGLDLLRETSELRGDAPVILLTGQGDHEVDVEAMKAGAADYLIKGQINAANLERSIRYAIQQKQMAEERVRRTREEEARTQAEAANRAKDEFLAMVSHELRTPLNSMLGWVGILRNNKGDEEISKRAIDAIERSARVQNKLVNDLLDISRIASGNLWIERQPVPLVQVIQSAIDESYPSAAAKSIKLEVKLDHSVGLVSGDPSRLQQVMNNFLQNAVKFTPEGGSISVTLESEAGAARVSVTDTGKGISPEFLPFVFERYRQASDTSDRRSGLGLGLTIARHIIDLHGGEISAESAGEDMGSTFSIVLPLIN